MIALAAVEQAAPGAFAASVVLTLTKVTFVDDGQYSVWS